MLSSTPGKGSVWRESTPRIDLYRELLNLGGWEWVGGASGGAGRTPAGGAAASY